VKSEVLQVTRNARDSIQRRPVAQLVLDFVVCTEFRAPDFRELKNRPETEEAVRRQEMILGHAGLHACACARAFSPLEDDSDT
jgi:hypothetical protein